MTLAEQILSVATQAKLASRAVFFLGARHNYIGYVVEATPEHVVLSPACVAFDTGPLSAESINTYQIPPGGTIIVNLAQVEAIMVGKRVPAK